MPDGARAIAYIRVSVVGDRAKRGRFESPELQRNAIIGWCAQRGYTVIDEFEDLNRSGGNMTRPGLLAAIEIVSARGADGIVVAKSDRASRRTIDGLGLIDMLERRGAWLAAADGSIDTTTRTGRMATTMHFAMAQSELERYQEQAAVIHERAIVQKGRHMGPAPFGYVRDDGGRLVLDPERAVAARMVFELRAEGRGWVSIVSELERIGVRQVSGRRINQQLVRRMVPRRVYVGDAYHGHHRVRHAHQPLVDEALWAAANRSSTLVRSDTPARRRHPESLLRGLLRCSGCRYVMKRQPQPPFFRWKCRTLLAERSATHDCAAPARLTGMEGARVEQVVVDRFLDIAADAAVQAHADAPRVDAARRRDDAAALLDELSSLDVRRELGPERWRQMTAEAREALDDAELDLARQRTALSLARADRVGLRAAWPGLALEEQQQVLRSGLQAVMVAAGDAPIEERLFPVPVGVPIELPRKGAEFEPQLWLPGSP